MQRDSVCTTALFKVVLKANGKGKSQMMSLTGSSKWFYQIVRGLEGAGEGGGNRQMGNKELWSRDMHGPT